MVLGHLLCNKFVGCVIVFHRAVIAGSRRRIPTSLLQLRTVLQCRKTALVASTKSSEFQFELATEL
jgi:hypothetical protein